MDNHGADWNRRISVDSQRGVPVDGSVDHSKDLFRALRCDLSINFSNNKKINRRKQKQQDSDQYQASHPRPPRQTSVTVTHFPTGTSFAPTQYPSNFNNPHQPQHFQNPTMARIIGLVVATCLVVFCREGAAFTVGERRRSLPLFARTLADLRSSRCLVGYMAADNDEVVGDTEVVKTQEEQRVPKVAVKCPNCDMCDGSGRILGGLGAVLPWVPVKAYRPCPNFIQRGGEYKRSGQGLDEIAFGAEGKSD